MRCSFKHADKAACRSVVDPVVDVEGLHVRVLHTAAVDIGLVGDDECSGNRRRRRAPLLLMVADGVHDQRALFRRHAHARQYAPRHQTAAQRMIFTVNGVADVVQIAGDVGQLMRAPVVAQPLKDVLSNVADQPGMALSMFSVADTREASRWPDAENAMTS